MHTITYNSFGQVGQLRYDNRQWIKYVLLLLQKTFPPVLLMSIQQQQQQQQQQQLQQRLAYAIIQL